MRCSCGAEGTIVLPRRDLPYCQRCFEELIVTCVRREAPHGVALKPTNDYFFAAANAACALAKRPVTVSAEGKKPGCTETAAAGIITYLLGTNPVLEEYFPKTITLQELQMFFKADQPVQVDTITEELITFDKTYPGTTRSILNYSDRVQRRRT
jgi:hypothetical protein